MDEISSMNILTLPALLHKHAKKVWRYTCGHSGEKNSESGNLSHGRVITKNVRDFALGLHYPRLQSGGDKLAYAGDNRPEGLYSELAVQSLGGTIVGIYPDSHLDQVEYIINHSDSIFVVAGDQEQADKVLDIKEKCPLVQKVIVDDPKGMRRYDDPILLYFKDIQKQGRELNKKEPHLFEEMWRKVTPDNVGMINYTSGTTGLPKGSMITQKNMYSVAKAQDSVDAAEDSFEYISFLPFPG